MNGPMQAAIDASREQRAVVMFTSPTCGPCKQMKPLLQALANSLGFHLTILSLADEGVMALAQAEGIKAVPAVLILDCGKTIHRVIGAHGEQRLRSILNEHKVTQLRLDGEQA